MAQNNSGRIVFAAILAIFVYGVIAAMLGVLLASFNLTPEESGNIALAQAIGMIIASLSAGPIIDKQGKKIALVAALGLIAVSLFMLPGTSSYNERAAWVFVLGLGGGILVTAANALAGDVNEERRSATLNFLNLFFGLGGDGDAFDCGERGEQQRADAVLAGGGVGGGDLCGAFDDADAGGEGCGGADV